MSTPKPRSEKRRKSKAVLVRMEMDDYLALKRIVDDLNAGLTDAHSRKSHVTIQDYLLAAALRRAIRPTLVEAQARAKLDAPAIRQRNARNGLQTLKTMLVTWAQYGFGEHRGHDRKNVLRCFRSPSDVEHRRVTVLHESVDNLVAWLDDLGEVPAEVVAQIETVHSTASLLRRWLSRGDKFPPGDIAGPLDGLAATAIPAEGGLRIIAAMHDQLTAIK